MKNFKFLIIIFFKSIIPNELDEGDELFDYASPCEQQTKENKVKDFNDCIGKTCEYIEEICCYLESKNYTDGSILKECIDFNFYDYMREDLINQAKQKLLKGEYWESYNQTYDEIINLRCENSYMGSYFLLYIVLLCFLY